MTLGRYFYSFGNVKKSEAIAALASLAQESRLDIFRLLVQHGPEGLAAGEIGERLGLPPPTLSFHLHHLRHAGLVQSRRASRSIIYSANFRSMASLMTYLTENCCGGGGAASCMPAACAPAPVAKHRRTA